MQLQPAGDIGDADADFEPGVHLVPDGRLDVDRADVRFVGYNTDIRSIYIQPTIGYQVHPRLKVGIGVAYITSRLKLHQRADLSTRPAAPGITFAMLGLPTGTDFADASLSATGTGFAINFGGILKITDRCSIGGHWITRKTIAYDGDAQFT